PGRGCRRRGRRHLHVSGRARHPGVREDGQVAEERRRTRRHVRAVRRGHPARVRDVDGPAGPLAPVGDPCRGGLAAPPAAALTVTHDAADPNTAQAVHRTIDGVGRDMDRMHFNTAIAKLIELVNHLTKQLTATGSVPREAVEPLVLMVAPLAPHLAEELWARLGHTGGVSHRSYPAADPELLKAEQVTCVIQVKGKVRHRIEVDPEISEEDLEAAVMAEPRVQELLEGRTVRKLIIRAPKIVNIVV